MEISNVASKLKALNLEMSEDLLVHLVLISLPIQFGQFQVSYNCQKEKWSLNELISFCVQEEERLKQNKTESAHLASTSKERGIKRKHEAAKDKFSAQKKQAQAQFKIDKGCFFCKKDEHQKKECPKYRI